MAAPTHAKNRNPTGYQSRSGDLLLSAQNAKILTENNQAQIIHLIGDVKVIYRGQYLSADEAKYNSTTKELQATGHIKFTTPTVYIEGERLFLNYDTSTGTIYDAFMQTGQVQFEGAVINKTGPESYEALDGKYTACTSCPPAWSFSGTNIKADIGGYTYIKNPLVRMANIPFFWLPYIVVPLKSKRQTGLLFPMFEQTGSSGKALSESFFWAISPSQDATLTVKNYEFRGIKGLAEYRYVLNKDSRGALNMAYLRDRNETVKEKNNGKSLNRYSLVYDHRYVLPEDFVHRLNLNLVSDIRYPYDFSLETEGKGNPALENRTSLTKNTESSHTSVEAAYYINLLKSGYNSDNFDAVHRFPEIRYSLLPQTFGAGRAMFQLDLSYANFVRNTYSYDDRDATRHPLRTPTGDAPTRDGSFNPEQDLYRTGQRIEMNPRVSYPFRVARYIDVLPSVGFYESHYLFPNTDPSLATQNMPTAERRYVRTEISARTSFDAVFGDLEFVEGERFKHMIQPEVTYSSVPWLQASNHPFFGANDIEPNFKSSSPISESDTIQFDYRDRVIDKDLMTFAITNKLVRKRWKTGQPEYKQVALLKLSQSYDIFEASRPPTEPRQPYSDISALLDVRLDNFETNSVVRYFPYQNVTSAAARAKVSNKESDYFELNYSQDFQIRNGASIVTSSRTEDMIAALGYNMKYLTLRGGTQYNLISGLIQSYSYGFDLKPPGNCFYFSFQFTQPINSDYAIKAAFAFLFDGKTATSVQQPQL